MAGRPRFEVADIVHAHGDAYRRGHPPSAAQDKVMRHIATCRTAALGGHVDACNSCGHARISYNSCRDRHCPKCQGTERAQWLAQRLERLLPVPYFHVVFTLPHDLNPLALGNRRLVFQLLFRTAAQTLLDVARDKKHLGAQIGLTAVLHTWGQNLLFHPHLHCVVTGGGLTRDGTRWIDARPKYLLPVEVLGRLFRGKLLAALDRAYKNGELQLGGSTADLADPFTWAAFKDRLYHKSFVVYAKPPFGGPAHVFRYLGRYTHRVAISNHRIVGHQDDRVTFTLKNYKTGESKDRMTLDAVEFLRRFLLHVLPARFVRIRHYGLCAGRNVPTRLAIARRLLQGDDDTSEPSSRPVRSPGGLPWWERFRALTGIDVMACPVCQQGRLIRRQALTAAPLELSPAQPRASPGG